MFFFGLVLTLGLGGGYMVMFGWRGTDGDPTTTQLYLPLLAASDRALVIGKPTPGRPLCYDVHVPGEATIAQELCYEKTLRRRLRDGVVIQLSVGSSGAPAASIVGGEFQLGEWIGSNASLTSNNPRIPLRSYGSPDKAAQVVPCTQQILATVTTDSIWCIRVVERLGRLAIGNEQGIVRRLVAGNTYALQSNETFWIGLTPYEVHAAPQTGISPPALQLAIRSRPAEHGADGDRRWLGRLTSVDLVDVERARKHGAMAKPFAVYPMRIRYTANHLSRQRTDLEAEDVVQRLIDAELLCLNMPDLKVAWRSIANPGCSDPRAPDPSTAKQLEADYDLARIGFLSPLVSRLISRTNASLASLGFLRDPSVLTLDFDWGMQELPFVKGTRVGEGSFQPTPRELWGVHHGTTQISLQLPLRQHTSQAVSLSKSTSVFVADLMQNGRKLGEFATLSAQGKPVGTTVGSVCVGGGVAGGESLVGRTAFLGVAGVLPNGSITWAANETAGCTSGCRVELLANDTTARALRFDIGTGCRTLPRKLGATGQADIVEAGDVIAIGVGNMTLQFRSRGVRPAVAWKTVEDQSWIVSREFLDSANVGPLLGLPAAQSGVLAAINDHRFETVEADSSTSYELTIDGDLQKALVQIVREEISIKSHVFGGVTPKDARLSAVVMDGRSGAVLASISTGGDAALPAFAQSMPTAWELASEQARGSENTAFVRRGPIGSTMKVATLYALSNDPTIGHGPMGGPGTVVEAGGGNGRGGGEIVLASSDRNRPRSVRRCLGRHYLPRTSTAITRELIAENFAKSCNGFFSMTGIMYASGRPASLSAAPNGNDSLAITIEEKRDSVIFSVSDRLAIGNRIRRGLAADVEAGNENVPHSLFGVLLRLGFGPMVDRAPGTAVTRVRAAHRYAFEYDAKQFETLLHDDWFSSRGKGPALLAGRDFNYPTVPSPGRFDVGTGFPEYADGLAIPTPGQATTFPPVELAQLLIGQGEVEVSALGLAGMYSPMARVDGRMVKPCLFVLSCNVAIGARVVADASTLTLDAPVSSTALREVLRRGTASNAAAAAKAQLQSWGGKTGTYNRVRMSWPAAFGNETSWEKLVAHACGVQLLTMPDVRVLQRHLLTANTVHAAYVQTLLASPPGAATGARACVSARTLNPSGIHHNVEADRAILLDNLAEWLDARKTTTEVKNHAIVLLSLPRRGITEPAGSRSEGIIIAVLEDADADIAKSVGIRMAVVLEQWARVRRH